MHPQELKPHEYSSQESEPQPTITWEAVTNEVTELYSQNIIFNICVGITRDSEKAKELSQNLMLHIWELQKNNSQALPKSLKIQNLVKWLTTMATHLLINQVRRKKNQPRYHISPHTTASGRRVNLFDQMPSLEPSPEETIIQDTKSEYNQKHLEQAIAQLPQQKQKVLHMHHLQNMTCDEIAHELKITPMAVKMQLFRARQQMKKKLNK